MKKPKRSRRRRQAKSPTHVGSAPGTLIPAPGATTTSVRLIRYSGKAIEEKHLERLEELPEPDATSITWIDVVGTSSVEHYEDLGRRFGLHPLVLEDAVNVNQRPKLEAYGSDLFLVLRMVAERRDGQAEADEQLCILLRPSLVITFQERPGDCFDRVRERLRLPSRRIRERGADYLAYALLDAVIDAYQPALEQFEHRIEDIEDRLLDEARQDDLHHLHTLRRELIAFRRAVAPAREVVLALQREPEVSDLFEEETRVFLRDCYDHVIRTVDQIDTFRELCASLMDLYMSTVSNRTNDVMKVLTMIATVFIPLSFLVGLYGMNFDTSSRWNMPELGSPYGYPILVGVMVAIVALLLAYFKRQKWL